MGLQKLTDRQMQDFIRTGYVLVKPNLPDEFHQAIFRQTESVFETEFNPGNNSAAPHSGAPQHLR